MTKQANFDVLETTEATALEEMGASSGIGASSSCSSGNQPEISKPN
ncbi:thiazolylpeptide-type bacteriocin [Pseudoalteromonas luteoviolacea]|nr:thiazolylpeptide-type bacteriocin [Pseudoalteromonas luteoviolacea]